MLLIFSILMFSLVTAQLPTMPNIGYLGCGYDLMFGNPHVTNPVQAPDPGYRELVFNLSIYAGDTTPDQLYRIPTGTQVELCSSCSFDFQMKGYSGIKSYQNSLSEDVYANFSGWGARFSGSADYKKIENHTRMLNGAFTEHLVSCCVYKSKIQTFSPPPLSNGFINAVGKIPTTYDEDNSEFFELFVSAFGTHVSTSVTMGGKHGQRSQFSSNSWSRLTSSNLNLEASGTFSAVLISAAASRLSETQRKQALLFSTFSSEQKLFSMGGEIPESFELPAWVASAKSSPMPLSVHLSSLASLLTPENFPLDEEISRKKLALSAALQDYCNTLKRNGKISACEEPAEDRPFPPPSIYGGQYQVGDCQRDNVDNPYTGNLNCKQGYHPHLIARFDTAELLTSTCSASQYVCLVTNRYMDPLRAYGGAYQVTSRGPVVPNPMTPFDESSCPEGYSAVKVAAVRWRNGYSSLYGCWNNSAPFDSMTYAGGYTSDGTLNPHTNALSCPDGYKAYRVGTFIILNLLFSTTASMFACFNNVFTFA